LFEKFAQSVSLKSGRVRFAALANAHFANRRQISLNRKSANGAEGFTESPFLRSKVLSML
jgi:hypothetical protein